MHVQTKQSHPHDRLIRRRNIVLKPPFTEGLADDIEVVLKRAQLPRSVETAKIQTAVSRLSVK